MLDIKFIRENPELVQEKVKHKGQDVDIRHVLEIDEEYRKRLTQLQELLAQRNEAAKERDIEKGKVLKVVIEREEDAVKALKLELDTWLYKIPNLPFDHLPIGGESANKIIKTVGEPKQFDFEVKDHVDIGEALGLIDIPRATKVSGSRFAYLTGDGVLLELALIQHAMHTLVQAGFTPVFPPTLIKQEITQGLGYWQAGGNENYYLVTDLEETSEASVSPHNLYLVGTAEHALVPMHKDEVLTSLSKKYAGFSSAYRREAGTYGKDTRGILRVHQFDKVEMVVFCKPEDDEKERGAMLTLAETMLQDLDLPYQVVQLATGDISFPAAETIDIETWIPSQQKYRETHSISTCTDFQARRLNIKYQTESGEKQFVHILNGTAFAIQRTLIAILENYQQADGSVAVPEILRKYVGKDKITKD